MSRACAMPLHSCWQTEVRAVWEPIVAGAGAGGAGGAAEHRSSRRSWLLGPRQQQEPAWAPLWSGRGS